ncbi:MAG: aconitate hydratase [Chloroflexota bacterium]
MGLNLAQKLIRDHLVEGELRQSEELGLRIDQTLVHDALGTMALLQFEAMDIPRVKTRLSLCYVDHSLLQVGFENSDDHPFLQTMAAKYGLLFSRPGNGICHQVHLERFSEPGATLLGSDSHTPTCGAVGMLAIGAGGLDVAVAMGGGPYYLKMPKVVQVVLRGKLPPWVASKDLILELLRRLGVKGGVGRIFEFAGDGVESLTVPQRATVCNMGTELGATTSLFPSDETVHSFLKAQGREGAWKPMTADPDAGYDETIEVDLSALEPLMACPSSPDKVVPVREVEGIQVDQVCVGSCTNSSYVDLMTVAAILKGKKVHPDVSFTVTPGSRQVLQMISESGALTDLISAGARILECSCGPCNGTGQAPATGTVSVRSFNRNFPGRSGTNPDQVYLCSPQVAAAIAVTGRVIDPRRLGEAPRIELPERFAADDGMILRPPENSEQVEIRRGPNIKPLPRSTAPAESLRAQVLLKTGDNISTDDIIPAGAKLGPLRSNVPASAEYVFERIDGSFPTRAKAAGAGIVVGGWNYGQGSSREHAALLPAYLGVKAVLAKSFARIHQSNLINVAILPLTFADEVDYERIDEGDLLEMAGARDRVAAGSDLVIVNVTKGIEIPVRHALTPRQVEVYLAGGMLNYFKGR